MVNLFPSSFFFLFFMVGGIFISVRRRNWFLVWCGLEINLIGFIPIVIQTKNQGEVEAAIKYFLVQSIGSALVLFGSCMCFLYIESWVGPIFSLPVFAGLLIKLGIFPFYFWLPRVIINIS